MKPTVIDNFLPAEVYGRLCKFVQDQPMRYGSKSNSRTDPHGHWSWKPVHDSRHNLADLSFATHRFPLSDVWETVRKRIPECALLRCYANGYTYGTDGYYHTDSTRADEHTVIIYICPQSWDPDWAGETHWHSQAGQQNSAMPWPNRALILPSNLMHCARAVSRKCTELRLTLMFKVRARRTDGFEKLSKFLVDNGALSHKHKDGSLHDHLVRVYQLLEDKKLPSDVCFGGGLHSIYGTNVYETKMLEPNPGVRATLASAFGREAEDLAYAFSLLDRPKTLEEPGAGYVLNMRHNQAFGSTPKMTRSLQLIEAANLLDQGSLDKWPNLKKAWDGDGQTQPTDLRL